MSPDPTPEISDEIVEAVELALQFDVPPNATYWDTAEIILRVAAPLVRDEEAERIAEKLRELHYDINDG